MVTSGPHDVPRLSPNLIADFGFVGAILVGTALLKLPASATGGISWLGTFFEATIAVTATGLQVVLAVLIRVGGLGSVTVTALGALLIGGRPSYRGLVATGEEENMPEGTDSVRRPLGRTALFSLVIELVKSWSLRRVSSPWAWTCRPP